MNITKMMRRASKNKLCVKWNGQEFVCTHPNTNVTGHGSTISAAIKNWQYWWNIPY